MSSPSPQWKPNFDKWYEVDISAYKFILEQATKKKDEVLSESESITDKSMKIVAAVAAFLSIFYGIVGQKHIPVVAGAVPTILSVIAIGIAVTLLFPKGVRSRGIAPNVLIPSHLDSPEDKGFQEHMLYYSAIVILQDDIQEMRMKNLGRAGRYGVCLVAGLLAFVLGVLIIAWYS